MADRNPFGRQPVHDRLIDAALGDVNVPADLHGRMAIDGLFDDAAIDRLLAGVPVPAGLAERVRRGASSAVEEQASSRPSGCSANGSRRQAGRRRWRALDAIVIDMLWDGAAVAAALAIVVGMFMAGTALSRRLAPLAGHDVGREAAPGRPAARPPAAMLTRAADARPTPRDAPVARAPLPAGSLPAAEPSPSVAASEAGDGPAEPPPLAPPPPAVRAAPPPQDASDAGSRRGRGSAVRTVLLPTTRRFVPRVPEFDLAFELAHGEAPFVDPRVPALTVDRPPLVLNCDAFDSITADLAPSPRPSSTRPRRGGVAAPRVEELLAAVSPPAAEDEAAATERAGVRLSVGAVRSLRKSPETLLVELCATAAMPAAESPLDTLVVLDQSSGPGATLSWQWACRGLARIAAAMRPADRLSVVVCGDRPRLATLRADADGLARLVEELRHEAPARVADIDAGLRLVADVSRRDGPPLRTVVLAHAGSLEQCRAEGRSAVTAWQAARAGTVARAPAGGVEFVRIDPQPAAIAGSGADPGGVALDGVAVIRALVEQVFGRPTLVARGCRMEVRFNPSRVGSYRVVGHRQAADGAVSVAEPSAIDLHAGELVRVVYEVMRRPGEEASAAQELLTASLRWTPAGGGEASVRVGLTTAGLGRSDREPALSPHRCELLLAMGLGEWAAGVVHAEPRRHFASAVAGLAATCRDCGTGNPILARLVAAVEQEGLLRAEPSDR